MIINDFKVLVFDFDGVILDSVNAKGKAFSEIYEAYGTEIMGKIYDFHIKNGGMDRYTKIKIFEETILHNAVDGQSLDELVGKFSTIVKEKIIKSEEIPGVRNFLEFISKTIPCFVNSATPNIELLEIIHGKGLNQYFQGIYGSDGTKVDNLKVIISETGVLPTEVLFFGDSYSDYEAAKQCGVTFCAVTQSAEQSFKIKVIKENYIHNFNEIIE